MLRDEYEALARMGNLSVCNIPDDADPAAVWAIHREFELRVERLAREWRAPSVPLAA